MSKILRSNINNLKKLKEKDPTGMTKANKNRTDEVIKLYTDRRISSIATAENLIKGLTSTNKKVYDKAFQKYKDNIKKFKEAKPLSKRVEETRTQKQEEGKVYKKRGAKPRKNTYLVNFNLYTIRNPQNEKIKPAFKYNGRSYYIDSFDIRSATIKASEFPKEVIGKKVFRFLSDQDYLRSQVADDEMTQRFENPDFTQLLNLLMDDEEFKSLVEWLRAYYDNLFDCVKITKAEVVNRNGENFDLLSENLRDATHVSIYHRYVHTPIKMSEDTLQNAIKKGNYIENECWINTLTDFYSDTLMNPRTRNRLTREKIIEILGRDNFHEVGATILEMEPVFKMFNTQVRIFNFLNQIIYKYEPEKRNHHIKTFYAMIKNSHIYTLNHDLNSIQHKKSCNGLPIIKASTDYYLNEKEEPPPFKMIAFLNDILKIETEKEIKEVYVVPELNNLTELLFEAIKAGYEPRIKLQAGIITEMRFRFNKITYIVKTQNLIKTSADGCIAAGDETTYNNMNKAMFNFNKSLFVSSHRSFYNDIDIKILNESKTVVPLGKLWKKISLKDKMEIDISQAFAKSFTDITEIPIFNQFDNWKAFDKTVDIHKLHELTLYYVKVDDVVSNGDVMQKINEMRDDYRFMNIEKFQKKSKG